MKFLNILKHLIVNFRAQHRVSFRNPHNDSELWYIFISPMNIFFASITLIIVSLVALMFVVAYTPILDLIPGYPGNKSRHLLLQSVMRLDSLERSIKTWEIYETNISTIMEGKHPVSVTASATIDSVKNLTKDIVAPTQSDSIFRATMDGREPAQKASTLVKPARSFELYAPSRGVVTTKFDIVNSVYGITVSIPSQQPIVATSNGVVVLTSWAPDEGYLVQIQHAGNMISSYKHLSQLNIKTGQRVKAGEVIGYVGGTTKSDVVTSADTKTTYYFELWDNGTPVDPENYILF